MKPPKHHASLKASIRKQIRHLNRCLPLVSNIDPEIYALGRDLFTNDDGLAQWLTEPNPSIRGKVPLKHIRTAKGRHAVIESLKRILYGIPI